MEAINSLKLRLGWGVVGNQWAGSYAYGVTMASAASIWGTGFYAGNYPNRELKWEETNSFNVGLDLALFNNRIEFIADAYYKKTDNLLMQASLPTYVSSLIPCTVGQCRCHDQQRCRIYPEHAQHPDT